VPAGHQLDAVIQASRDLRADLVGGRKRIEPCPAWRRLVDKPDRLIDAQAQCFGVDNADIRGRR
jgi:hypothetical protein